MADNLDIMRRIMSLCDLETAGTAMLASRGFLEATAPVVWEVTSMRSRRMIRKMIKDLEVDTKNQARLGRLKLYDISIRHLHLDPYTRTSDNNHVSPFESEAWYKEHHPLVTRYTLDHGALFSFDLADGVLRVSGREDCSYDGFFRFTEPLIRHSQPWPWRLAIEDSTWWVLTANVEDDESLSDRQWEYAHKAFTYVDCDDMEDTDEKEAFGSSSEADDTTRSSEAGDGATSGAITRPRQPISVTYNTTLQIISGSSYCRDLADFVSFKEFRNIVFGEKVGDLRRANTDNGERCFFRPEGLLGLDDSLQVTTRRRLELRYPLSFTGAANDFLLHLCRPSSLLEYVLLVVSPMGDGRGPITSSDLEEIDAWPRTSCISFILDIHVLPDRHDKTTFADGLLASLKRFAEAHPGVILNVFRYKGTILAKDANQRYHLGFKDLRLCADDTPDVEDPSTDQLIATTAANGEVSQTKNTVNTSTADSNAENGFRSDVTESVTEGDVTKTGMESDVTKSEVTEGDGSSEDSSEEGNSGRPTDETITVNLMTSKGAADEINTVPIGPGEAVQSEEPGQPVLSAGEAAQPSAEDNLEDTAMFPIENDAAAQLAKPALFSCADGRVGGTSGSEEQAKESETV